MFLTIPSFFPSSVQLVSSKEELKQKRAPLKARKLEQRERQHAAAAARVRAGDERELERLVAHNAEQDGNIADVEAQLAAERALLERHNGQ